MNEGIEEKLTKPKPIRFGEDQYESLRYIGRRNNRTNINKLSRIAAAFLIKLTEQNNGVVPLLEQALVRRARRDAKRNQWKRH